MPWFPVVSSIFLRRGYSWLIQILLARGSLWNLMPLVSLRCYPYSPHWSITSLYFCNKPTGSTQNEHLRKTNSFQSLQETVVLCRWERETNCSAMPVEEWNTKMFYQKVNIYSGPSAREAPWVRKIDDLKSRKNLFMMSPYELASSWQTLGEGEGSLNRDLYRKLLKTVNFPIFRFPFPPSPTDRYLENIQKKKKTSWIYIAYCDFFFVCSQLIPFIYLLRSLSHQIRLNQN